MKRKKNISESKIGEWCLKKKYTQKLEGYWHRPIYRSKFVVRRGRGEGGTGTFPTLKRIRPFSVSYISRVLNSFIVSQSWVTTHQYSFFPSGIRLWNNLPDLANAGGLQCGDPEGRTNTNLVFNCKYRQLIKCTVLCRVEVRQ